jgi:hypothetical protein
VVSAAVTLYVRYLWNRTSSRRVISVSHFRGNLVVSCGGLEVSENIFGLHVRARSLRNQKVHYIVPNSPPLVPILCQSRSRSPPPNPILKIIYFFISIDVTHPFFVMLHFCNLYLFITDLNYTYGHILPTVRFYQND